MKLSNPPWFCSVGTFLIFAAGFGSGVFSTVWYKRGLLRPKYPSSRDQLSGEDHED